jgi:hypothetical protein
MFRACSGWITQQRRSAGVIAFSTVVRLGQTTLQIQQEPTSVVPEPPGMILPGSGLAGIAGGARRRRRQTDAGQATGIGGHYRTSPAGPRPDRSAGHCGTVVRFTCLRTIGSPRTLMVRTMTCAFRLPHPWGSERSGAEMRRWTAASGFRHLQSVRICTVAAVR